MFLKETHDSSGTLYYSKKELFIILLKKYTSWENTSGKLTIEDFIELARWSMGNKVSCYADLQQKKIKYNVNIIK